MAELRPTVYVESTIPSYLNARPNRDIIIAGHQRTTQDWWPTAPLQYQLLTSQAVLDEISDGDPDAAADRMAAMAAILVLAASPVIDELAEVYRVRLGIPEKAAADAVLLAYTVIYELDDLVTWNCTHLANGNIVRRLIKLNQSLDRHTPLIVTPEALTEPGDEHDQGPDRRRGPSGPGKAAS